MKDYIPAGAGEKMQYMVHPFNDNTIRFLLRYSGHIQADVLKKAVRALVGSVDVLHASFVADKLGAKWHVHEAVSDECFACIEAANPVETGFSLALESIEPSAPVQLRCMLIQGNDESVVVLLISHLCADGSDGKYLLNKLCEAYRMLLETGSCTALNVKNGSRAVEQVYNHLSKQEMRQLLKDPRTGIKCEFTFPTADAGQPTALWRRISADTMTSAHDKARQSGATINDLLLTSCYYAYVETIGLERHTPMSIMSMMDLRRHCDHGDTEGLCNLTGSLPTALPDGLCSTFDETLACIADQTCRCKSDPYAGLYGMPLLHGFTRTLPLGLVQAVASRVYGSMSLGLTNVGSIDLHALRLDSFPPVEGWFGGPVKRKPGVQISTASFGGACALCIWGYASDGDKPVLEQLLDCIASRVEAYAASGDA